MTKRDIFKTKKLTLDYDPKSDDYILKKNDENVGRRYQTTRQVIDLIGSFKHNVKTRKRENKSTPYLPRNIPEFYLSPTTMDKLLHYLHESSELTGVEQLVNN